MEGPRALVNGLSVQTFPSKLALGAAAPQAAAIIRNAVHKHGRARIIVGTGNSQLEVIEALVREPEVAWPAVEVFHLDEYVSMTADHPASFRRCLRTHLVDKVQPGAVHYIAGDAPGLEAELRRYAALLTGGIIDLSFVGFGENGHFAFNSTIPVLQTSSIHSC